ncbi:LacI family DNA-binding transcriptional regulator [Aquipuribacter sp. MA13-6]|uniref:LacI family DNA-binding transcriptional regulator n=1 Tax=unclassified Aquipuribacter TaxID=2635084 RepID=UPI003EEE45E5
MTPDGPRAAIPRATLADVARLAGVSVKTVSRVVSGETNVRPETRDHVMQAARRLRFRPNHLARDLRRGGVSTTVAFVIGDLTNPFYSRVAAGIERTLAEHGLTMVLAATDDDPGREAAVVQAMLERRVRSLILVPIATDQGYLEGERQLGTPVVTVDRPASNLTADSVVFANQDGAREAVRSLLAVGHRRIAFIGSSPTLYTHGQRLAGYRSALASAGIDVVTEYERTDAPDSGSAEKAARELLDLDEPPTAVLAGNNRASTGVLRAWRGLDAPPALIGFDDFDLADALGITVVAHEPEEMGREAALLALTRQDDLDAPVEQLVLPTRLVPRGSGEQPPPD